jgi:hypothetical protein
MVVLKRAPEFLVRKGVLFVTPKSSAQPTLGMTSTVVSGPDFGRAVVWIMTLVVRPSPKISSRKMLLTSVRLELDLIFLTLDGASNTI